MVKRILDYLSNAKEDGQEVLADIHFLRHNFRATGSAIVCSEAFFCFLLRMLFMGVGCYLAKLSLPTLFANTLHPFAFAIESSERNGLQSYFMSSQWGFFPLFTVVLLSPAIWDFTQNSFGIIRRLRINQHITEALTVDDAAVAAAQRLAVAAENAAGAPVVAEEIRQAESRLTGEPVGAEFLAVPAGQSHVDSSDDSVELSRGAGEISQDRLLAVSAGSTGADAINFDCSGVLGRVDIEEVMTVSSIDADAAKALFISSIQHADFSGENFSDDEAIALKKAMLISFMSEHGFSDDQVEGALQGVGSEHDQESLLGAGGLTL